MPHHFLRDLFGQKFSSSVTRFPVAILFMFLISLCWANPLTAQGGSKPNLGDIIQYSDTQNSGKFGLVMKVGPGQTMKVETVANNGFDNDTVMTFGPNYSWKLISPVGGSIESRKWSTKDGKFTVEAKLVGIEGDTIRLEKPDGLVIDVPSSKFSARDQTYIRKNRSNLEAFEEGDLPDDVMILKERRDELMVVMKRHKELSKINNGLMVGDIIIYDDFHLGQQYGLVRKVGFAGKLEIVDKDGELEEKSLPSEWNYFDREAASKPMDNRTWKSSSGSFSVKARLVGVEGENLTLEKDDGEKLTVPLSKLSSIDQKYTARVKSKLGSSNEELERERLDYDEVLQKLLVRRDELLKRETANRMVAKAASKMKPIALMTKSIGLSPSQLRPLGAPTEQATSTRVGLRAVEHASISGVGYAKDVSAVGITTGSGFVKTTLSVVDLASGESVSNIDSADVGKDGKVVAMSPSGQTLILFAGSGFDHELELWKNESGRLTKKSVISYESFFTPKAHLFSDQNGVVQNTDGNLVFFDVGSTITPTHHVPGNNRNSSYEITDDQKSLVLFNGDSPGIRVIDVATKKCVGGFQFNANRSATSFVRLHPSGETVAHVSLDRVDVYNLKTGEQTKSYDIKSGAGNVDSFQFLGADLMLLSGRSIFDFRLGMEVATLKGFGFRRNVQNFGNATRLIAEMDRHGGSSGQGGFGRAIGGGGSGGSGDEDAKYTTQQVKVAIQRLPVNQITQYARQLTETDVVDFGAGDTVKLVFNVGDQGVENQLRNKLQQVLSENNIQVANDSDFVFEFSYKVGQPQTENFRIIGFGGGRTRKATVTPKTASATLKYQGETLWANSRSGGMGRPFSEEDLDRNIKNAQSISARSLLEFKYPNKIRMIDPRKRQNFDWQ